MHGARLRAHHEAAEWRTAYVAVTRARHRLYLSGGFWQGGKQPQPPSPLLEMARGMDSVRVATWLGEPADPPERLMIDEGYQDNDPLQRLIMLKWYLRAVTNAIIDSAIHVDGMTRDAAMKLMVEGGFQEEREAAGKWVRAQLTSAQLSTYFVGYLEHKEMRAAIEKKWGDDFTLRRYHDQVLSYGSPPARFVRALMLGDDIPRRGD